MTPDTPDWVKNAVFYQIYPDRFARSSRTQHPPGLQFKPWGTPPEEQGFQGGDLLGIVERLDYLQDLGINALYLNPIFSSASNHRYHTFDYMTVDPLLGGDAALRELLDAAHERGMRVVLDGVFNHASRGFWPFHHVLECGGNSPYIDWFTVHDWPLVPYPRDAEEPHNFEAWCGMPMLPKLNTANPGVREMIFSVAEHWLQFGIDGWRLDVPNEIDDDDFWREFRRRVRAVKDDAYICGEIWGDAQRWLAGDMFDAVMNYPLGAAILGFAGRDSLRLDYRRVDFEIDPLDAAGFVSALQSNFSRYHPAINAVQMNLFDSHDTARALWMLSEDVTALQLAVVLQLTLPGAPCIYYGDEIGLSGGDDPHCRGAFPWDDETVWNQNLLAHYQSLTALRHRYPALRTGAVDIIHSAGNVLGYRRHGHSSELAVYVNAGAEAVSLKPVGSQPWQQVWPASPGQSQVTSVELAPRSAVVLATE